MKKILTGMLIASFFLTEAQIKISALPAASAPAGTEVLPVVQSGVTKKITINQLTNFALASDSFENKAWLTSGNSGTNDEVNYIGTSDSKQLNFGVNGEVVGEFQTNGLMHVKYGDSVIDHQGERYVYHGTRGHRGNSGAISLSEIYFHDTTNLDIVVSQTIGNNLNDHGDSLCYDLIIANRNGGRIWNWAQGDSLRQYMTVAGGVNSAAFVTDTQNFVYSTGDFDTTFQINVKDKFIRYNDGNQANGYGLVSNANGLAHWGRVPIITSGTSAPATTPNKVGDIFVDTSAKKLYFSTGTSSSADWTIAN